MEKIYLRELITAVKGEFLLGDPHSIVSSISIDSRTIRKGNYYFAIAGKNHDGHNFLQEAVEKGASGLIIARNDFEIGNPFPSMPAIVKVQDTSLALGDLASYYRKKWNIPLVAITGSNGKTSTKEMLGSILQQRGNTLKTSGNFNNQIGLPLTLLNLSSEHAYAVIEMGTSFPGEIKRLAEIASPTIGIITNIGLSHLERFKNQEGVLAEKRVLLENLASGGCGVINIDDPYLNGIASSLPCEVITTGIEKEAMVRARKIDVWPDYPKFELVIQGNAVPVTLPVYGKFNVYNALAAAAAAWKLGFGLEEIKKGLETFSAPDMRMEVRNLVSGITVINDAYNANPSSMRASLSSFVQSFTEKSKIAVLGDMLELGEQAEPEHRKFGEYLATQPLTHIILYGPMMEKALPALAHAPVRHFSDREDMELELKRLVALTPDCVVFFKGSRGMHLEETINRLFSE